MKKNILLTILLSISIVNLKAQVFHTIIVSATNDGGIGVGCQQDIASISNLCSKITTGINYTLSPPIIIQGDDFKIDKIKTTLKALKTESQDIVFFYYTGHGFNPSPTTIKFPYLDIEAQSPDSPSINEIHEILKNKHPRLCITLGDLCNSFSPFRPNIKRDIIIKGAKISDDFLRQLFIDKIGDIKICSSRPPQVSITLSEGSIYTNALIEALNYAQSYNKKSTWEEIFIDSKNRVRSKSSEISQFAKGNNAMFDFLQQGGQEPIAEFNLRNAFEKPQETTKPIKEITLPNTSFAEINKYLNDIIDERIDAKVRLKMLNDVEKFFVQKTIVRKYINSTYVQGELIEDALSRLCINAKSIYSINFIEKLSELDADGKRYKVIAIQEIWKLE